MQVHDLPPFAPTLMESTRHIGYSIESAVADIVDNSISAGANSVKIEFVAGSSPYLYILDNGDSLSKADLLNAMKYGSKSPTDIRSTIDMGRFGLGLKTASLSQCRCLTVVSKKDNQISGCRWDLDYVISKGSWALQVFDTEDLHNLPGYALLQQESKGTLVLWERLDMALAGATNVDRQVSRKLTDISEHLSLVFHRYLTGERGIHRVCIGINGVDIEPVDPFLVTRSEKVMQTETIVIENSPVEITAYILPHISRLSSQELKSLGGEEGLRKRQGFYVYRNKRLIIGGTWFKLTRQDELYKLARVQVDIPNTLDHLWNLDIKKSIAKPPEEVAKNLQRIIEKITSGSKRTYQFRGRKEVDESISHVWERQTTREGVKYLISRENSYIVSMKKELDSKRCSYFEELLRLIESSIPVYTIYIDSIEDTRFALTENENCEAASHLAEKLSNNQVLINEKS